MDLFELFPTTEMTYHGTRQAMLDEEFFEFFGELGTGEEDYRDYLQKESRILSLVKKKKVVKERYTADPFMKAISANALREMNPGALFQYLRKMALKHLIEPVFEKIGPMYADQKDVLVEDLEPFMQTLFPSGVIQLREATPHEACLPYNTEKGSMCGWKNGRPGIRNASYWSAAGLLPRYRKEIFRRCDAARPADG